MLTFEDYKTAISSNHRKPIIQVDFLRQDETFDFSVRRFMQAGTGSLTINNKNGVRRACEFTLINFDKRFLPDPDRFWIRRKFKLWLGLEINGQDYLFPQGIFIIENPSYVGEPSKNVVHIRASDKFCLLDGTCGGKLEGINDLPVGSNIYKYIRNLLKLNIANDFKTPILDVEYQNQITPYSFTKGINDNVGSILLELAKMLSANVYYDVDGHLVFENDTKDYTKGSIWNFKQGDSNYLGITEEYLNDEIYNAVWVMGDNVNGDTFTALVKNENLLDPNSIPNTGYMNVIPVSDSNISSDALAINLGKYKLKRVTAHQRKSMLKSVPLYHLDVDNVVTATAEQLNIHNERYLINGITLPFDINSSMSLNIVKTEELAM